MGREPHDRLASFVRGLALAAALCSSTVVPGCGRPPDEVPIASERVASRPSLPVAGASSDQRFGGMGTPERGREPAASGAAGAGFDFMTPPGWVELPASSARAVHLRPAGHPDAECYVAVLGGSGGGLASNVDRWRSQMGLEALGQAAAEALPEIELLGSPAKLVELEGAYSGMGSEARAGWKLIGAVQVGPEASLFVKMTAPAVVIESERAAFLAFCDSLKRLAPASDGDPALAARASVDPLPSDSERGDFRWSVPEGWKESEPRPMRLVSFTAGGASECYVTVLGGQGGGLVANLDRWRSELGLARTTPAEVAAMLRVPMLGREALLFEGEGEYSSMGGPARPESMVLGAICLRNEDSVFVKMIGPRAEVQAQREAFLAFVASFEELPQ